MNDRFWIERSSRWGYVLRLNDRQRPVAKLGIQHLDDIERSLTSGWGERSEIVLDGTHRIECIPLGDTMFLRIWSGERDARGTVDRETAGTLLADVRLAREGML